MAREATGRGRPTLTQVAASAGVSLPTASKVIHGHPGVSADTRARVKSAIEKLSYIPRSATTQSVAVMSNQPSTPYAMEILVGVTDAAEDLGIDVVVSRFRPSPPARSHDTAKNWARRLAVAGRTGAIILTAHLSREDHQHLAQEHLPVVAIDPVDPGTSDVPSIGSTNFTGGFAATEHVVNLGHRRLAAIGGNRASVAARARMHGFHAACATAGVEVDPRLVTFGEFTYESGLSIADEWLALPERPTAIVTGSDAEALGVIEAARRHGLSVPRDLSVVGYDDTFIAGWATPPLTTVRQPLRAMGAMALETVLALADGRTLSTRHLELATELVVRSSTGPHQPEV